MQGEFAVEAFGCGVAAFEGEVATGQEEDIEFLFFLDNLRAGFVDVFEEGDIFLDEGDAGGGVDGL